MYTMLLHIFAFNAAEVDSLNATECEKFRRHVEL